MGSRGPIRSADSRRGKREVDPEALVQEAIQPSYKVGKEVLEIFNDLVSSQTKAGIDIRASDSFPYTNIAVAEFKLRQAIATGEDDQALKWLRILNDSMGKAGFGAVARARLGLRDKKKAPPAILELIKRPV